MAADCDQTSVGLTPISELGASLYLDAFEGGLYPNGLNQAPAAHRLRGITRAAAVEPRLPDGTPSADGHLVLLSIGMSNTTQEFCAGGAGGCAPYSFVGQALAHPAVETAHLVMVDGAAGGQTAGTWDSPQDANYDRIRDDELAPLGLSELQVQAVWVKVANSGPQTSLPAPNADAYQLVAQCGDIARALRVRYPNVQVVFFSSRIYAGYASTALNPEPFAYESAFAVKWLVEAQIRQMAGFGIDERAGDLNSQTVAPWIGWGPYFWADGLTPRADGLTWACSDYANDGTHPSPSGREKVGTMLLDFMLTSPFAAPWFRADGGPSGGDLTGDGLVGPADLAILLAAWGPCGACDEDLDGNGFVGPSDLALLLANWS
jgi:hypothetical protein